MAVSKRVRFEVFKRDSFTCQYCGKSAPSVILELDHVNARANGGTDDILNLVTSCEDCNRGKSNKKLSDDSTIAKQKRQLEHLQKRREQIDMMFQWQKSLLGLQDETVNKLSNYWDELTDFSLTDYGKKMLAKLLNKFSIGEIMEAMKKASDQYCDGTEEKNGFAFNKIGAICRWKYMDETTRNVLYVRGILKNRGLYINDRVCTSLIREALEGGATFESMKLCATNARSWTAWRTDVEAFLNQNCPVESDA